MFELAIVVGAVVVVCYITNIVGGRQADDVFDLNDEGKTERAKLAVEGAAVHGKIAGRLDRCLEAD